MKKIQIWMIANMYPTSKFPYFGVFIRNFYDDFCEVPNVEIRKTVLIKNSENLLCKIIEYGIFYWKILKKLFFDFTYNVIYVHYPLHTAFFFFFTKKKVFFNFHGSEFNQNSMLHKLLFYLLEQVLKKKNVFAVVPSEYYKNLVLDCFSFKDEDICIYPSGGVDKDKFHRVSSDIIRDELGIEKKEIVFGYISNFIISKGIYNFYDMAIDIIQKNIVHNVKFIMIGSGPEKQKILNKIKTDQVEKSFSIIDAIDQSKLKYYYSAFDIFVFPSFRDEESLGLVGLEAMSCGTLVVAANNKGVSSYLKHGYNGFLFEMNSTSSLVSVIEEVVRISGQKRKEITSNAFSTVDEFRPSYINEKLLNWIKSRI